MGGGVILELVDLLMGSGLLVLALLLLLGTDIFRSIVLFIVFGILMALAWARLNAPDLALAEAIVGAGVTGVLLIAAWRRLGDAGTKEGRAFVVMPMVAMGVVVVAISLIWALAGLEERAPGLTEPVLAQLHQSGVRSPVTAVLLNFRGYDTLLELGVLLLAVLAAQLVAEQARGTETDAGPVLEAFASLMIPLLVVVSGMLLWRGSHAPGGAFQAGSLLGSAGILILLVSPGRLNWLGDRRQRKLLTIGPLLFMLVAILAMVAGKLLEYPRDWAGALILLVEAAATFSIAAALMALFIAVAYSDKQAGDDSG